MTNKIESKNKRMHSMLSLLFVLFLCLSSCDAVQKGRNVSDTEVGAISGKPNIILIMADDLGYGDVGFNGNLVIKTPSMDQWAVDGMKLNRFYAAAPVCSPTRGSVLTGRHPFRYGIYFAMSGHIKQEEVLLPEILKEQGYTTGHFGKWHLGTLTDETQNRWGGWDQDPIGNFSPPWKNGYDACFVTESKVPTWNPMYNKKYTLSDGSIQEGAPRYRNDYWEGAGKKAEENLEGDDSRVIMDRVIPFIEGATNRNQPFFSVVWFHTPHKPVITGPKYRDMYPGYTEYEKNYYGCITAMDEQIGRLRSKLQQLKIEENTIILFCSDNGPEGETVNPNSNPGSAGIFSGRKRSLLEGGIRVPAFVAWKGKIQSGTTTNIPAVTSDYFPSIMDIMGMHKKDYENPIDGISLKQMMEGKMKTRNSPIGFKSQSQRAWITERYKIYSNDSGQTFKLFDLIDNPTEKNDLSTQMPELFTKMKSDFLKWEASCANSDAGNDYN